MAWGGALDGCAAPRSLALVHPALDVGQRPVIAHRGNRAHAPENTMEAFRQAVALGADALELDVHVSADGVPVVHHDATLDRTTDGTGPLAGRTLAELRKLDAGARWTGDGGRSHPYRGREIGVPTLAEVLDGFPTTPLVVEIKTPAAAPAVLAALERHGARARVVVDAFDPASLAPLRGRGIALGASRAGVVRLLGAALAGEIGAVPYQAVFVPPAFHGIPLPVRRFARLLRPHGVPVHVWTVNHEDVAAALWRDGICGIVTDDPATLLALRTRGAGRPPSPAEPARRER